MIVSAKQWKASNVKRAGIGLKSFSSVTALLKQGKLTETVCKQQSPAARNKEKEPKYNSFHSIHIFA